VVGVETEVRSGSLRLSAHLARPDPPAGPGPNGLVLCHNFPSGPRHDSSGDTYPELADRLLCRLFGALADRAEPGERLQVSAESAAGGARISISRPEALKGITDASLFESVGGEGVEGGFSLRLARGLARIAGGDLISSRDAFALLFPRP